MNRQITNPQCPKSSNKAAKRPNGTRFELFAGNSGWITPELVKDTLKTWNPYYNKELSEADAIQILQNFGRLINLVNA